MKLGSLFDGSGGFPLAARLCGIEPVWASEIEEYPIRVTKKNFPNMKHLGDITKIDGGKIEPVDIITFGSPCQDLSVAGKRAGLEGERSGLFMEAIRLIKEMRDATDGRYPTFIIWENVFGAFSSNNGDDFWTVLKEIHGITQKEFCIPRLENWTKSGEILGNGASLAWRTMDAQYWGVAQRRRRVFVVADFRGGGAGKILFERPGLSGNFNESKKTWQTTAKDNGTDANDTGGDQTVSLLFENHEQDTRIKGPLEVSTTLATQPGCTPYVVQPGEKPDDPECLAADLYNGEVGDKMSTLRAGANESNRVMQKETFPFSLKKTDRCELSPSLDTNGGDPTCNQGDVVVVDAKAYTEDNEHLPIKETDVGGTLRASHLRDETLVIPKTLKVRMGNPKGGGKGALVQDDLAATLSCTNDQALFEPTYSLDHGSFHTNALEDKCGTLTAFDFIDPPVDNRRMRVRKLMPIECCRLQGFPDDWCDGVEGTDADQYKMWGNGVALPCVLYIMEGLKKEGEKR